MESHNLSGLFADRYSIERPLGRGASATVYLAHDTKQDREIALKVLDAELANAIGSKRFLQEIHITSRLQHPHILPIHDSGEWNGMLFYTLPFVAGESLRAKLVREKQLPIEECVQITCDVASALAHAHSKGVIHRDVKPENILLSDGHALIADFGIARTTEVRTGERLTSSGLIVGTSQYMSPEQASGERNIDPRSDIYSLGCVLYEMLAGIEPFVGPNVQAVIAQRFTHAPRPVTMFRPNVPATLEDALNRALSVSPADRYQTMKDFARDLPVVPGSPSERRRPGRSLRDMMRTSRGKATIAGAAFAGIVLVTSLVPRTRVLSGFFSSRAQLDTTRYVVIPPLDTRGGSSVANETGELLHDALSRWTGIGVVKKVTVQNALAKSGAPSDLDDAERIAISLGAGKLVWGKIVAGETPGSSRYEFSLVDVKNDTVMREVSVSSDSAKLGPAIALSLLQDPEWPEAARPAETHTHSLPALQAYGRGHAALNAWDIGRAAQNFAAATSLDSDFPDARLWSAQLKYWSGSDDWVRDAQLAAVRSSSLAARDSLLARALGAMAEKNYPAACAEYRQLIAADSMSYLAWQGLGECLRRDEAVIASRASPSGWAFRSSYGAAASAFARAAAIEPGAHAIIDFSAMQRLLAISPTRVRRGVDAAANLYAAFPSLIADTIAYVPYPLKIFSTLPLTAIKGRDEALDRNARELERFTTSWIRAYPKNADAYESLANVLEAQGNIAPRIAGRRSASEALFQALVLATSSSQRTRLAAAEVRLRVKRGEFKEANRLADSLLSSPAARDSDEMIVVSGFVGRTKAFSTFAQRFDGWLPFAASQYNVPAELRVNASDLFARAALGECGSDIAGVQAQIDHNLDSYISPDKRDPLRHILTARSLSMLTPCTAGASSLQIVRVESALQRAQQAFAKKRYGVIRTILDSLRSARIRSRPGDLSLDAYYQEAWLRANIGDSAGAASHLDRALTAIGAFSVAALKEPASAAALGRAMILRSSLAAGARDYRTASKWADAVDKLYAGADAPLRKTVDELKTLVRNSGIH